MRDFFFLLFFFVQRDFDEYWDTDRNGLLEGAEITTILQEKLHISTSCMIGLIKSCDSDGNPGISKQEWFTCFKTEGKSHIHFYSCQCFTPDSVA